MEPSPPVTISAPVIRDDRYDRALGIVRVLRDAGHQAYFVGGGVRDVILGRTPKDYDIVTSARPNEVEKLFRRTIPVGAQYGVMTVVEQGVGHEVATYRAEGDYRDGRRPGWVEFADLEADVTRRDFTINGLVHDPDAEQIFDYVGGLDDLRRGIIRTIGDARERFADDSLRILRAVRFAARLDFRLERATRRAIVERADDVRNVAVERVWQELDATFRDAGRTRAVCLLRDTGVLSAVLPELAEVAAGPGGVSSLWSRTVRRLSSMPDDASPDTVWAGLLADMVAPDESPSEHWQDDVRVDEARGNSAAEIMTRTGAPRALRASIAELVTLRWGWRHAHAMRHGALARVLRNDPDRHLTALWTADAECFGRGAATAAAEELWKQLRDAGRLRGGSATPPVSGADILGMGVQPGPRVGEFLAEMERLWLENELETAEAVSRWASTVARGC